MQLSTGYKSWIQVPYQCREHTKHQKAPNTEGDELGQDIGSDGIRNNGQQVQDNQAKDSPHIDGGEREGDLSDPWGWG